MKIQYKNTPFCLFIIVIIFCACSTRYNHSKSDLNPNDLLLKLGIDGDVGPIWKNNSISFRNYKDTVVYLPDTLPLINLSKSSRYIYDVSESMLTVCKMKENPDRYSGLCTEIKEDDLTFFREVLGLSKKTNLYAMEEVTYHPSYKSVIILSMREDYLSNRGYDNLFIINIKGNRLLSYAQLSLICVDLHSTERQYTTTDQKTFVSISTVSGESEDFLIDETHYSKEKILKICTAYEFNEDGYLKFIFSDS